MSLLPGKYGIDSGPLKHIDDRKNTSSLTFLITMGLSLVSEIFILHFQYVPVVTFNVALR